jgi:hypothetical protein
MVCHIASSEERGLDLVLRWSAHVADNGPKSWHVTFAATVSVNFEGDRSRRFLLAWSWALHGLRFSSLICFDTIQTAVLLQILLLIAHKILQVCVTLSIGTAQAVIGHVCQCFLPLLHPLSKLCTALLFGHALVLVHKHLPRQHRIWRRVSRLPIRRRRYDMPRAHVWESHGS